MDMDIELLAIAGTRLGDLRKADADTPARLLPASMSPGGEGGDEVLEGELPGGDEDSVAVGLDAPPLGDEKANCMLISPSRAPAL